MRRTRDPKAASGQDAAHIAKSTGVPGVAYALRILLVMPRKLRLQAHVSLLVRVPNRFHAQVSDWDNAAWSVIARQCLSLSYSGSQPRCMSSK